MSARHTSRPVPKKERKIKKLNNECWGVANQDSRGERIQQQEIFQEKKREKKRDEEGGKGMMDGDGDGRRGREREREKKKRKRKKERKMRERESRLAAGGLFVCSVCSQGGGSAVDWRQAHNTIEMDCLLVAG